MEQTVMYRMPAEWEPHERTFMGWPDRPDVWRVPQAQKAFAAVAEAISHMEPVTICTNPDQVEAARKLLPPQITVLAIPQNDSWFRDIGPSFVLQQTGSDQRGKLVGVDWIFNAWGGLEDGLYSDWRLDAKVASTICRHVGCPSWPQSIILEGGAIHVDGEGTLMTTEECLLRRNPSVSMAAFERIFREVLGVTKVHNLVQKPGFEEHSSLTLLFTHNLKVAWAVLSSMWDIFHNREVTSVFPIGHIDNIAAFARPGVVLLSWTDDLSNLQYARSAHALEYLQRQTDAQGRRIEVTKLPIPPALCYTQDEAEGIQDVEGTFQRTAGTQMAGSYANFYIANGGIVVPFFGVPEDEIARQVLQKAFPERRVVGVYAREILLGGGNIHCITQQQPLSDGPAIQIQPPAPLCSSKHSARL